MIPLTARRRRTVRRARRFLNAHSSGTVDDFDGIFQRLRLETGEYEMTLYLPGHQTVTQQLLLQPGRTLRVKHAVVPLAPTDPPEPRKRKAAGRTQPSASPDEIAPPGRVDLHGLVVEEALARIMEEIDRSLLRGADRVEVVHGKGTGRIRNALHRHLASMAVVAAFRLDPRNAGVTWVHCR
jgi:hypothetical protein